MTINAGLIDYVVKIVAAYDKALGKLDDGFSAVKKKKNPARTSTAPDDLFVVDKDAEKLSEESSIALHHLVAKLYVSKRARPDVSTAIAFLTTRVRAPDINGWMKLSHLMEYLRVHRLCPLILSADGSRVLMWYVIASSCAVHPDMCNHTGGGLTMGRGFPIVSPPSKS
jgi:hypothetical protein